MPLRIGLAGLGTVGGEVARLVESEQALLAARAGKNVTITAVSARDKGKKRAAALEKAAWVDRPADLAARGDVDAVVEVIGGAQGAARDVAEAALKAGKPLITANKALLAHHGQALAVLSEAHGAPLYFEAAVAGGIPAIKALREALAGNRVREVSGILNGTCNYILSTMRATGRAFADVLQETQKLGYAEADPSFDVDGLDAGHKLVILAALAFGVPVNLAQLKAEGIRGITPLDLQFAEELGYRIKLLGVARLSDKGLMQRVSPYMVPLASTLAHVEGVANAVYIDGSASGPLTLTGLGAGAGPTASAVLADIIDCAVGRACFAFGLPAGQMKAMPPLPDAEARGAFYMRLKVVDRPGVLADLAAIMRDSHISIQSLLQKGQDANEGVPVVFITHGTSEKAVAEALARLAKLPSVLQAPTVIRIVPEN